MPCHNVVRTFHSGEEIIKLNISLHSKTIWAARGSFCFNARLVSKILNPRINGSLIGIRVALFKRKRNAEGALSSYWRSAVLNKLLLDKIVPFIWPSQGLQWKWQLLKDSPPTSLLCPCVLPVKLGELFLHTLCYLLTKTMLNRLALLPLTNKIE